MFVEISHSCGVSMLPSDSRSDNKKKTLGVRDWIRTSSARRSRMVVSDTAASDTPCFVRKRRRKHSTGLFSYRGVLLIPNRCFGTIKKPLRFNYSDSKKGRRASFFVIGVTGFEPAASWSRTKHSTGLSHTPITVSVYHFFPLLSILPPNFFVPFFQNNSLHILFIYDIILF